MRLRSKLLVLGFAALAGFLASRQDIREDYSAVIADYKLRISEALEKGKEEAAKKKRELTINIKNENENIKNT